MSAAAARSAALSASGGDLGRFFTTSPVRVPDQPALELGAFPTDVGALAIKHMDEATTKAREAAEAGAPGAALRFEGLRALFFGDPERAAVLHEQAAEQGDTDSMFEAGCVALDRGDEPRAQAWFERGALAGQLAAMHNLGGMLYAQGERAAAEWWWVRAGEAGHGEAWGVLTSNALDRGEDPVALRWAERGAAVGEPFCLMELARLKIKRSDGDHPALLEVAVPLLERAARGGRDRVLFLLGIVYLAGSDHTSAAVWLRRSAMTGDDDAIRVMRENGL